MAIFVFKLRTNNGTQRKLIYDNETSDLLWEDGKRVLPKETAEIKSATPISISRPGKKESPKVLKISLGLSCNYECNYCSQRFVPAAVPTSAQNVDSFVDLLTNSITIPPERIEFWGGEPFVYWKTLKPLAEKLRALFPEARFAMVTNGSLLDIEKNEWLDELGFTIAISHDGPGYHARGLDPLDDPEKREMIADLYNRLHSKGRITINAMLHRNNQSRASIQAWLQQRFGQDVRIGEGTFIDPYDNGGLESTLDQEQEQVDFRKTAFLEIRDQLANNFIAVNRKINGFIDSIKYNRSSSAIGQKCQMDRKDHLAVDLMGNTITCQNVSANAIAPNGQPHRTGFLSDLGSIAMKTSTHWSQRKECPNCPVLQLCAGGCMFLEGALWEAGCETAYSDNVAFLAAAIHKLTDMTLLEIESSSLPERRKAIWKTTGFLTKKKVIPIHSV